MLYTNVQSSCWTALGCADMSPPDGAWMTRDDDTMEIGCHSGSKSWSLRCVDNRWQGVLGQCGSSKPVFIRFTQTCDVRDYKC